jgi:hypothetical protein
MQMSCRLRADSNPVEGEGWKVSGNQRASSNTFLAHSADRVVKELETRANWLTRCGAHIYPPCLLDCGIFAEKTKQGFAAASLLLRNKSQTSPVTGD